MPTTLDIVALRSLVAVATCGGFHRAARALHLTQSAVSRHVQRLEDALGVELVVREGRGIRFTPAGERLLGHARSILDAHDDAVTDLGGPAGELTVGAMDHAADLLLPELVDRLRERFTAQRIQVRLGRSARLRESVDHGSVDVALVLERRARDDLPAKSPASQVISTRWVGSSTWQSAGAPVPLVLFDHHCGLRSGAVDTLAAARIGYTVAAEAPDLAGIHAAVRAGLGVTVLPELGRLPHRLRTIDELPTPPPVVVGIRIGGHVEPEVADAVATLFGDLLQEHLNA
ncbi:LysR family transcriptional regulator [Nocardia africana]